jgi:hypothetical protein
MYKGGKHTEEAKLKMHTNKTKKTHCKRGHERTPDNVYAGGRCKLCAKVTAKNSTWKKRNPEKAAVNNRRQNLKHLGWTLETYESAKIKQEGRCAICNEVPERALHADHEHIDPPRPRELLCSACNAGLGMFKDNPEILVAAVQYARKWKQENSECLQRP